MEAPAQLLKRGTDYLFEETATGYRKSRPHGLAQSGHGFDSRLMVREQGNLSNRRQQEESS